MHTSGLTLLKQELARHGVDPKRLNMECLRDIVACARVSVPDFVEPGEVETSGMFTHMIKGLATHVAGLLGVYGREWPIPDDDVVAELLREHRIIE
jgi:hypothetical protein